MSKSQSEGMKKHWAKISPKKRSERTRKGGIALWKKIKAGNLTMSA